MSPAGKLRYTLNMARRFSSSIELMHGTNIRSLKLGLNSRVDLKNKNQMIKKLREP